MPRGGLTDTHMNTNSFKINQRIKRINVFDYLIIFTQKIPWGGDSQIHR